MGRLLVGMLLLLLIAGCSNADGDDLIVLQDGSHRTGTLQGCLNGGCQLSGRPIPQATIAWIGLHQARSNPPQPNDPAVAEIRMIDRSVHPGLMTAIDPTRVTTLSGSYDRQKVAWVYLTHPAQAAGSNPPKPVAFPDSVGSKGGLWIGTAHGEKTVTYTRPTLVVHNYKNTIRVRLREVVGGVIFNSDPAHFHRIGSEIDLKNEGTQYEGDYQGTVCSDHEVRPYRDITLGHFWYKTLDEPIKKGSDIPPEGLYELVFL